MYLVSLSHGIRNLIRLQTHRGIRTTTQNVNSNLTMEGGGGEGKMIRASEGAALPSLLHEGEEEEAISQLLPQS